jgi:hypothetical protein
MKWIFDEFLLYVAPVDEAMDLDEFALADKSMGIDDRIVSPCVMQDAVPISSKIP